MQYFMKNIWQASLCIIIFSIGILSCNSLRETEQDFLSNSQVELLESEVDLSGLRIGYSSPSLNAPFYVVLSQYIELYTEAYGMSFVMADGQDDIIKQITSMEDLISSTCFI